MATAATLPRLDRTARALGIIARAELTPLDDIPGLFQVRDSLTGSGACHIASSHQCDCYDAQRGNRCKHQIAVAAEEQALADYAAEWDRAARPQQPRCPMCGCPIESRQFYTGGRGWAFYEVCSGDSSHSNRR